MTSAASGAADVKARIDQLRKDRTKSDSILKAAATLPRWTPIRH